VKSTVREAWSIGKETVVSLNWLKSQVAGFKNILFLWRVFESEASSVFKSFLWLMFPWLKNGFVTGEGLRNHWLEGAKLFFFEAGKTLRC